MDKTYIDSFLSESEKTALQAFASNETAREAVKKVILAGLYQNGTLRAGKAADPRYNAAFRLASQVGTFSNEDIGADVRALWEGINSVETGFQAVMMYAPQDVSKVAKKNEAR